MSGCICCTVRADLITVVKKILGRKGPKLDGIIIETTGLADPAPVGESPFSIVQCYSICLRTSRYCYEHKRTHTRSIVSAYYNA
jgi:G3E family GTPase